MPGPLHVPDGRDVPLGLEQNPKQQLDTGRFAAAVPIEIMFDEGQPDFFQVVLEEDRMGGVGDVDGVQEEEGGEAAEELDVVVAVVAGAEGEGFRKEGVQGRAGAEHEGFGGVR